LLPFCGQYRPNTLLPPSPSSPPLLLGEDKKTKPGAMVVEGPVDDDENGGLEMEEEECPDPGGRSWAYEIGGEIGPADEAKWRNLVFITPQECEEFYSQYALHTGFAYKIQSRKPSGLVGDTSGILYYLIYQCRKAGGSTKKAAVEIGPSIVDAAPRKQLRRNHPQTKFGCDAIIRFGYKREEGVYR
ncbi:hypothetical protein LINGRAHAP2_LOCUS6764, partial [Linum grandiflorum]